MIFVFEVRIRPGHTAAEYAEAWVRASELIQSAPGARGTRLHRKIGDPNALLAIASWDSKGERDTAEAHRDPRVQAILDAQSQKVEIRVVGEFEDPAWTVLPPPSGRDRDE
jgi:heme-degrading monooxygenase HmoA